jgi:tRNA(fMet)-specific endonuclease VapC
MSDFLLDCNHLSAAIRKVSTVRERIRISRRQGNRFVTCSPVLCELEAGIQQSASPAEYRRRLGHLLGHVRLWHLDRDMAQLYGQVFHELRRQGRVLSQVDMMLAAMARQHKMILLTADKDFEALPDIRTEDWSR